MEPVSIGEAVDQQVATEPGATLQVTPDQDVDAPAKRRWRRRRRTPGASAPEPAATATEAVPAIDIAPNDPLLAYLQSSSGVVDLTHLTLDSPAVTALREAGVVLVVPLVASGELVGMLQLGPRLSERDYSKDDRELLEALARHAAPALRLGQLVREQEVEAASRERIEQELRVAQLIQQQFLPKQLPDLPTWDISAFYRPARTVGGDFYDFITLPNGHVMVVTGDVTDKGVPAALVMASTHSLLREAGPRLRSPAAVLAKVNEMLCEDIPAHMFVTCLVMVLDPPTGQIVFANAGHNLPYVCGDDGKMRELRATGMPLGLMKDIVYEEAEATIAPGERVLLYSDGLTEQHDADGEMFGFGRTADVVATARAGAELTDLCVAALAAFTGADVEQEDDITLVALRRTAGAAHSGASDADDASASTARPASRPATKSFSLPSEPGNERQALAELEKLLWASWLEGEQRERLNTAVAEATMNAIEHGNHNDPELMVDITATVDGDVITVEVSDHGAAGPVGQTHPDLELKLAGLQTPRGWGLFLIENMVDEVDETTGDGLHTVRLTMRRTTSDTTEGGAS
ncbi:MAG: SpoIIE family protein phosphatase [Actinomycetes bacterium]